ncbi:glycoside hydrolase family 7 protein [Sphaerobolus stellatus SS14]|uniref:Glucanase n=1 Tax=Sphaerobolus stellatus (strain SS14) TaxID=990650 RepID=A0A0C9T8V6_SPHS4|nr:glycoside hydrolase family 7 protein [Sphaerobolus stellatus SS14]
MSWMSETLTPFPLPGLAALVMIAPSALVTAASAILMAATSTPTARKVTVVTQFLTDNNSTTGTLSEIRCLYVQKGVVIQNSKAIFPDIAAYDSITDQYCDDQKSLFGDTTSFQDKDGLKAISESMARGMVFVMSVWDDHNVNMLWLDSSYPIDADATKPGIGRGSCPTSPGASSEVETNAASTATYSNIRYGDIGSSFSDSTSNGGSSSSSSSTSSSTTTTSTTSTSTTTASTASQVTQTNAAVIAILVLLPAPPARHALPSPFPTTAGTCKVSSCILSFSSPK